MADNVVIVTTKEANMYNIDTTAVADEMIEESIERLQNEHNITIAYMPYSLSAIIDRFIVTHLGFPVVNPDCISNALH